MYDKLTPQQIDEALKGTKYENAAHTPLNIYGGPSGYQTILDYGYSAGEEGWFRDTVACCQDGKLNAARAIILQRELDAVKAQRDKLEYAIESICAGPDNCAKGIAERCLVDIKGGV